MKKIKFKPLKVVAIVLGLGLASALVIGGVKLLNKDDDGFKEINPKFSVGSLDENGKYKESKGALYTKNPIELSEGDELTFTLDFDGNIEYQLFYYDVEDTFVSKSEILSEKYNYVAEEDVNVRVMITPVWSEDVSEEDQEISSYWKWTYTTQLTIELKQADDKTTSSKLLSAEVYISSDDENIKIQYEEGMTWAEWVNSDYNILDLTVVTGADTNKFLAEDDCALKHYETDDLIRPSDLIDNSYSYEISYYSA